MRELLSGLAVSCQWGCSVRQRCATQRLHSERVATQAGRSHRAKRQMTTRSILSQPYRCPPAAAPLVAAAGWTITCHGRLAAAAAALLAAGRRLMAAAAVGLLLP